MFKECKTLFQALKTINILGFENLEHFEIYQKGKCQEVPIEKVKTDLSLYQNLECDFILIYFKDSFQTLEKFIESLNIDNSTFYLLHVEDKCNVTLIDEEMNGCQLKRELSELNHYTDYRDFFKIFIFDNDYAKFLRNKKVSEDEIFDKTLIYELSVKSKKINSYSLEIEYESIL